MKMSTVDEELEQVESRLSESWEALSIQRTINEMADKQVSVALNERLNLHSGFWRTTNISIQTTIFTGIFALLNEHSSDSATFYSVLKHTSLTKSHAALNGMKGRLDGIKTKYTRYRHKLFGHNDKNRQDWANRFNAAGFTWTELEKDFGYLDYAFKVLWQLNRGDTPIDEANAQNLLFPYDQSRHAVIRQTEEFLRGLISPPHIIN